MTLISVAAAASAAAFASASLRSFSLCWAALSASLTSSPVEKSPPMTK